ncbi:MAG TPA: TraB/GumN family protein [Candidatus Thermoplasmatota archaeon]|nr:TraB/GumN family protein [Candidatus Thermoplasmatota archaeon]
MIVERGNVVLVGTAHVSRKSVDEVRDAIRDVRPKVVAVELDPNRFQALTEKRRWEDTPITELLRGGRSFFILAQTMLASFQRRVGARYGVEPGAEMLAGIEAAKEVGAEIALADRDIGVTLKRAWHRMRFREKWRLGFEFSKSFVGASDEEELDVDEMVEREDVLTLMMEELSQVAPSVSEVLVSERDRYLAERIRQESRRAEAAGGRLVAVVGAGHVKGIVADLERGGTCDLAALEHVPPPPRVSVGKVIGWGLLAILVGVFAWLAWVGVQQGNFDRLRDAFVAYVLITGTASAVGALVGGAHPFSILTAFVAAPFTILHPTLAAGWFSGYVEAKVRTPTVGDFERISRIQTLRDFWRNRLMRVLLVAATTNLGAMTGAWLAAGDFVRRVVAPG